MCVCLRLYVCVGTEPKPQKSERDKRKNELDKKMWYKNLQCTKCVIKQRLPSPLLSLSRSPPLSLPCGRWDNPWAWPGRTLRTFQCIFYAARGRSHVCNWCCSWCASCVRLCVCACAFISLLRPCTLCRKTKTATMKINIRQQQHKQQQVASARSTLLKDMPAAEQNSSFPWPSVGNPTTPFSSLPAIGSVVFVFTMLCLCVCVLVYVPPFCAHCLAWCFISYCV